MRAGEDMSCWKGCDLKNSIKIAVLLFCVTIVFGGQMIRLDIKPGGMLSDVVETELGGYRHQWVKNLRQVKKGEWQTVKGYRNVCTGFGELRAGVEVTDDTDASRFLLLQDSVSLVRVNWSGTTYVSQAHDTLELPLGVTIADGDTVRFDVHNSIVRISGASEPMRYEYMDRELFEETGADDLNYTGWYLTRAAVVQDSLAISLSDTVTALDIDSDDNYQYYHFKLFAIFDDGQYTLLSDSTFTMDAGYYGKAGLKIEVAGDSVNLSRLTSIGFAVSGSASQSPDSVSSVWSVVETLPTSSELTDITYTHEYCTWWNGFFLNRMQIGNEVGQNAFAQDGYLSEGVVLDLRSSTGSVTDATIDTIFYEPVYGRISRIHFDKDVATPLGLSASSKAVDFTIKRTWTYSAGVYSSWVGVDLTAGTDFYEYTEIAAGTADIDADYTQHVVIGDRAYIVSAEEGEDDVIRYSPTNQFDVFPNLNIIQTEVGDADQNRAIAKRDDRLVILKRNSMSQGNFSAGAYYQDIGFARRGLYASNGFIVIDNVLYFMDREDVLMYRDAGLEKLMSAELMQQAYQDSVNGQSFFGWDKANRELLLVLGGLILVYHPERNEWYQRETEYDPTFAIYDIDGRLLLCAFDRVVTFNHDESVFGEEIEWSVTTSLLNIGDPRRLKKIDEIAIQAQGMTNGQIRVRIADETQSRSYSRIITPDTTHYTVTQMYPDYFFREAEITFESYLASGSMDMKVRGLQVYIDVW